MFTEHTALGTEGEAKPRTEAVSRAVKLEAQCWAHPEYSVSGRTPALRSPLGASVHFLRLVRNFVGLPFGSLPTVLSFTLDPVIILKNIDEGK